MKYRKNKNTIIRKHRKKSRNNTRKNKMKGGGFMDYFTSSSIGINGFSLFGKSQSKQYCDSDGCREQPCYSIFGFPVCKTV
uniref:Uncharacterized protein n=1 Tax=viral metagenome TaxID=1070528 RepID=A0A6C0IFK9_9ZZZZ